LRIQPSAIHNTIRARVASTAGTSPVDHGPKLGDLIIRRYHPASIDQRRQVKVKPTST